MEQLKEKQIILWFLTMLNQGWNILKKNLPTKIKLSEKENQNFVYMVSILIHKNWLETIKSNV